jgi:hypothetical protein
MAAVSNAVWHPDQVLVVAPSSTAGRRSVAKMLRISCEQ